ncbi:hypothetical protein BCR37DRAFT_394240 [Protomyces lactucae-debilis]|uniref:Methyltransferase n=1 Tax=Protomyces lactucae-debilis TaxID=2754530 RepID=A0A1Y2F826_PROLT|nr:uncharacterized protein BCR37DRAFT_394240 [Protomyces lactucae-debilis]ORY79516.1 hypothetical protein BCR37DRAFT_394240 [Protomyces lactucae-debilis]
MSTVASLTYVTAKTTDGKKHWVEGGVTEGRSNFTEENHRLTIHDLSDPATELKPSLDVNGFEVVSHAAVEKDFLNEEAIKSGYYKEMEEFLKGHTGASRIFLFDHTIRKPNTLRGPYPRVHVDQTTKAAYKRVEKHLPELASSLIQKRFQIINMWRPIENPAYKHPLAFADFSSVDVKQDSFATDRIDLDNPGVEPGETVALAYNEAHRWYYHKDLATDQVVLIKCFDSDGTVATFSPHTAFVDDQSDPSKPERQSIELRALVFYD